MRIAFYTDTISEHQIPLFEELQKYFGEESLCYFYVKDRAGHRKAMMGADAVRHSWTIKDGECKSKFREWIEYADILYTIFRLPDLFERRINRGLHTFYMSERWFKPWIGILRMLYPPYFYMSIRMLKCLKSGFVTYLPTGVVAAYDMVRAEAFSNGHIVHAFIQKQKHNGACKHVGEEFNGIKWIRVWGYFVRPGNVVKRRHNATLKVLWVGRFLHLKRVDTIIKAVKSVLGVELDIYGAGAEERRYKKLIGKCERIALRSSITLTEVRTQMRLHDVYVMASNGFDGWGAVVSEALEEGMLVLGTFDVGSTATILPRQNLFHVGDWRTLAKKLSQIRDGYDGDEAPKFIRCDGWRVCDAAKAFIDMVEECV